MGDQEVSGFDAVERQTQVRAYLDYSVTHLLEGTLVLDEAVAECRRRQLAPPLEQAIEATLDQGRAVALRKELAYLADAWPGVEQLERDAERRVTEQLGTASELMEIRFLVFGLRQLQSAARAELSGLQASGKRDIDEPATGAVTPYQAAALEVERLASLVRRVAPFGVTLRGGVATLPAAEAVDWFGTVEVSYNLGGIVRDSAEEKYLSVRSREMLSSPDEIIARARAADAAIAATLSPLRADIQLHDELAAQIRRDVERIQAAGQPGQLHALAVLSLRLVTVEARLRYLRELLDRRRPWEGFHAE